MPLTLTRMSKSPEAAAASIGAARPEFSGYLLLDIPEISLPGMVDAVISSELPGTSHMVLLRQFPEASTVPARSAGPQRSPQAGAGNPAGKRVAPPPMVAVVPPTVLISAVRLAPGAPAVLKARFNFQRNERFTMLVFAQGRWFATSREVKVAQPAPGRAGADGPYERSPEASR